MNPLVSVIAGNRTGQCPSVCGVDRERIDLVACTRASRPKTPYIPTHEQRTHHHPVCGS